MWSTMLSDGTPNTCIRIEIENRDIHTTWVKSWSFHHIFLIIALVSPAISPLKFAGLGNKVYTPRTGEEILNVCHDSAPLSRQWNMWRARTGTANTPWQSPSPPLPIHPLQSHFFHQRMGRDFQGGSPCDEALGCGCRWLAGVELAEERMWRWQWWMWGVQVFEAPVAPSTTPPPPAPQPLPPPRTRRISFFTHLRWYQR